MKAFKKILSFSFLLILPVGYYTGPDDSTHITMGGGAGIGHYATLIEGCEGKKEAHLIAYTDVGGSVAYRPTVRSPLVLGFRGGYFSVQDSPEPRSDRNSPYPASNHAYINPNISLELKRIGIGAGWLRNLGTVFPPSKWAIQTFDFRRSRDFPSGHIRIGSTDSWYALASFCEGVPIMTQYGTILGAIGHGSPGGKTIMGGICGGIQEHAGLFGCMISKPGRLGRKVFSFRVGRNYGVFEVSVSLGLFFPIK